MLGSFVLGVVSQVVVFAEPGFPVEGAPAELPAIEGAAAVRSGDELNDALGEAELLVWRHGATFPAESWGAFTRFLERGGSWLHLGGEPMTRPVVGEPGARVVQPRTVSLLKELRLDQSYRVEAGGAPVEYPRTHGMTRRVLSEEAWVSVLEPRFSDTKDFAHEDGAPGARDAILRPLGFAHREGHDPRFPFAAVSYAIDRLRGRFAGGRWTFHLASDPMPASELRFLVDRARETPVDLRVDPTFGCFHEGERPSVIVRVHRPLAVGTVTMPIGLSITRPDGSVVAQEVELEAGRHASERVALDLDDAPPGLYRVVGSSGSREPFETGFWVMDRELFESGDELAMGTWALERNGVAEPVIGATVMSNTVHRKFLFEPNAAVWDDTFREMASTGMNLVRTGIWSAYRKISLDPGVVDEAFLRALEAYYLSARKHGLPVVFTFFSFVPESFGGTSPYFDPRSIEGQRAYVSAIVRRFADAKEMLWDLINEPSFSNPDKLWLCRPNGDAFEAVAFLEWLEERFAGSPDGRTWQDVVRARWRLRPDEAIGLPTEDDFAERQVMEHHRPYRAKEWIHFAQDAFTDWAEEMVVAIREAGSDAAVTVGQDEGGLMERPSPLYHHGPLDFTSIHTWWFNDALLWDGLMAKVPGKPLLVSETGIMQRELLSGESIRSPESSARLLERKIAYSFAAGAFGLVEWCYDVNPYMASDNEVAIGLKRVDGSYKPEHEVMRRFAAFFRRNPGVFDGYVEPEDVLLFPSSDHWGPRSRQADATKRLVERVVAGNRRVRVVPEHRTSELGTPPTVVLPSARGLADAAWRDLRAAVERGSQLHVSGWFETDDAGLPAERLGVERQRLARFSRDATALVDFPLDVVQSWWRAHGEPSVVFELGTGSIWHDTLPLDWTRDQVAVRPGPFARAPTGHFRFELPFDSVTLVVEVNERDAPSDAAPSLAAGSARLTLVAADGEVVDRTR